MHSNAYMSLFHTWIFTFVAHIFICASCGALRTLPFNRTKLFHRNVKSSVPGESSMCILEFFLSNKLGIKITSFRHRAISVVTFALRTTVVMKKVAVEKKRHVDLYIYPQKEIFLFPLLVFIVVACLHNFFFTGTTS